jgi:chromate transporter
MTLLLLFGVLFLVNLFTIGGGYVMLPLLHGFFVERFAWMTNQEFMDAVAMGQVTPGPLTVMNAFIGFKVAGLAGAVTATAGSYLPSLLVTTFVTKYYLKFKTSKVVSSVFRGIKPVIVGMLLAVCFNLGAASLVGPIPVAIGLSAFALMAFTKIDPTLLVLAAGVAGAALL